MRLAAGTQKKQWLVSPPDPQCESLAQALKVSPLLAQVLINRGITDPDTGEVFIRPKLTELISPELMPGVKKAVQKIRKAITNKEKVTVYGDYDVDGISGVSILWQLIKMLGGLVDYYIPHRIEEGYGLNNDAVKELASKGTKLLITVDCGINAVDSADLAKQLGMDLIITDHHQPGPKLPDADIVHPSIDDCYPNPNSCGAMVAFKVAWALANDFNRGQKLSPHLRDFMINATSLAAMGTVADIVDLKGENRTITSFGLKSLPQCPLSGIQALIETAGLTGQGLDSYHIGFRLAPMLNAAGRMGHARLAVELLTSDSPLRSVHIAEYLKQQNSQRQRLERKIFKQACEMIVEQGLHHPDNKSIVLSSEDWHTGVIGIVASKIVDKYYRPTIMFNSSNGLSQGSARSIFGFDILDAISSCSSHLTKFGGHKMAAGLTIETHKISNFTEDLESYARNNLKDDDIIAKLNIDAEVTLDNLGEGVVNELKLLEPFGQGNPRPLFVTKDVTLASKPRKVGANNDHLQIAVTDNTSTIRCIGFGMGALEKKLLENEYFSIVYQPDINNFNGSSHVQLVLEDIRFE